ncbi:ABC transporter permease [Oceanivirga miroungae]|uniref:Sulfate ABC transporter permease n=1 Tax=Oceanivirga miroungae TaxID=1130046 RepID=A0A6I8M845_9FUSO|nr:ABC transporter permease [Oceanivirga miroungae]VWL85609.1 sulfate ABC transporter permease [Oceanivirga miroungae]
MQTNNRFSKIVFFSVIVFLYLPIIMLIVLSFNESKAYMWKAFSLKWYKELFLSSPKLWATFFRSIIIALTSSFIAVIIATLGAIGIKWYNYRIKGYVKLLAYIPLVLPDIIIGVSLLIFFNMNKMIPLGMMSIFIAHTTFNIPFSLFIIMSRLDEFDYSIIEASRDLGATEFQSLTKVILPSMKPGIISAFLMSLTLSLDDYVITSFVTGPGSDTLPIQIYSMLKYGISPTINALSTILIIGTLVLALSSRKLQKYMLG